jgi:hypothetical protein
MCSLGMDGLELFILAEEFQPTHPRGRQQENIKIPKVANRVL